MSAGIPRPLVLVAGAWLGGWAWRDVATRLHSAGHGEVDPVTLTGLGERVVDVETHVSDVINLLDYGDLKDVVLVGHSYGGAVVTAVADRRPERLHAVVCLDTRPLPAGMTIAQAQPPEARERQIRDVEQRGGGWRWPLVDRDTLAEARSATPAGSKSATSDCSRSAPRHSRTRRSPRRSRCGTRGRPAYAGSRSSAATEASTSPRFAP